MAPTRDGVPLGATGNQPRERRRGSLMSAADLVQRARSPVIYRWGGWPAMRFPLFATGTVKGFPGSGKSTIATAAACCIAHDAGIEVLYVSSEEGGEVSAVERFRRVGDMLGIGVPKGVIISDATDVHEADADLAAYEQRLGGRKGFIVLDSLTQLRMAQCNWEDVMNSGHGTLFVLHTTTTGEARGGREPEFAASFNVSVDRDGTAVVTKSRWGATGEDHAFNARQPPSIFECAGADADTTQRSRSRSCSGAEIIPFPRRTP